MQTQYIKRREGVVPFTPCLPTQRHNNVKGENFQELRIVNGVERYVACLTYLMVKINNS